MKNKKKILKKEIKDSNFIFSDGSEIEVMHDRILVEPLLNSDKSESGLEIPDSINKEKANHGKVVAFGSKKISDKLKKGVSVIYRDRVVDNIQIEDKRFVIIKEDDVLAILNLHV
jgi:chaperonin GroES